jgi:hypothetical protein
LVPTRAVAVLPCADRRGLGERPQRLLTEGLTVRPRSAGGRPGWRGRRSRDGHGHRRRKATVPRRGHGWPQPGTIASSTSRPAIRPHALANPAGDGMATSLRVRPAGTGPVDVRPGRRRRIRPGVDDRAELIWLVPLMRRSPLWRSRSGGGPVETRITSASTGDLPRPPKLTVSVAFPRCLCTGVTAG